MTEAEIFCPRLTVHLRFHSLGRRNHRRGTEETEIMLMTSVQFDRYRMMSWSMHSYFAVLRRHSSSANLFRVRWSHRLGCFLQGCDGKGDQVDFQVTNCAQPDYAVEAGQILAQKQQLEQDPVTCSNLETFILPTPGIDVVAPWTVSH